MALEMDVIKHLVDDKPLLIFSKSSCCVSHYMKQLIQSYGANLTVYELDEIPKGQEIEKALQTMGNKPSVPAVFIGQQFVGEPNEVLSLHVQGKLVPMMMNARAIWIWNKTSSGSLSLIHI